MPTILTLILGLRSSRLAELICTRSSSEGVGKKLGGFANIRWLPARPGAQTVEQQLDRAEIAPGFRGFGSLLVVLAQPATAINPGDAAFHDPPARLHGKAFLIRRLRHHF